MTVRVGIIGDFNPVYPTHPETSSAIEASAARLGIPVSVEWVATEAIGDRGARMLDQYDGVWISPGAPYRSLEGALTGIRRTREAGKPLVGT